MGELIAPGDWPAILTRETTEQLRALLSDPARRTGGRPGRATYLLSAGLARCGRCTAPLAGHADKTRNTRRYVCVNQPGLNRCGRLTVSADALDSIVLAAVHDAIGQVTVNPAQPATTPSTTEADTVPRRLDELAPCTPKAASPPTNG